MGVHFQLSPVGVQGDVEGPPVVDVGFHLEGLHPVAGEGHRHDAVRRHGRGRLILLGPVPAIHDPDPEFVFARGRKFVIDPVVPGGEKPIVFRLPGRQVFHQGRLHRRPGDDGRFGDPLRRRHVFLHQDRGQREHVSNVVEAVTRVVRRKVGRRFEIDAQQITDGVVVFRPVQPPGRDATRVGPTRTCRIDRVPAKASDPR